MAQITDEGQRAVADIAERNGVSVEAAMVLLHALQKGHGTSAQFNHPELGGMGQWSKGGMTQVGDMFNDTLKRNVQAVCAALSAKLDDRAMFDQGNAPHTYNPDGSQWWPSELGQPSATGSQNDAHYALFADKHRLAVKLGDSVKVYDSGDHRIGGFAQQQGGRTQTLSFESQHGRIDTTQLREAE